MANKKSKNCNECSHNKECDKSKESHRKFYLRDYDKIRKNLIKVVYIEKEQPPKKKNKKYIQTRLVNICRNCEKSRAGNAIFEIYTELMKKFMCRMYYLDNSEKYKERAKLNYRNMSEFERKQANRYRNIIYNHLMKAQ